MPSAQPLAAHHLVRRRDAAQAVIDAFKGLPIVWGQRDCGRLAAASLRALGHSPGLSRLARYSTALGAVRALKRLGHDSPAAYMDSLGFMRIPPASALPGDIVALPGEGLAGEPGSGWAALTVAVGNGRVLGFHEGTGCCEIVQPSAYVTAWRVEPRSPKAKGPAKCP